MNLKYVCSNLIIHIDMLGVLCCFTSGGNNA